jgi:hypothetical protein
VVLGFESAALSLGPAKKDEELAKSPGPLSSGAYPVGRGSHEADASTADWGGQSLRCLLRPECRIELTQDSEEVGGTECEVDAANAPPLKLQSVYADYLAVRVE